MLQQPQSPKPYNHSLNPACARARTLPPEKRRASAPSSSSAGAPSSANGSHAWSSSASSSGRAVSLYAASCAPGARLSQRGMPR